MLAEVGLGARAVAVIVSSLLALGCGAAYQPGALDDYGADQRHVRAVGCLDVRVAARPLAGAPEGFLAVDVDLGNRCYEPVEVRLARIGVVAEHDGRGSRLPLHDPRGEIGVAVLDGHTRAHEVLAFALAPELEATSAARFCVDVSRVARRDDERPPPVCFDARDGEMHAEAIR